MRKLYFLILVALVTSCTHFLRKPASLSSDGLLHSDTITDQDFEELPKINGLVYFKFVVLPDTQGQWNQLHMIDGRQYAFHYQYLATLPQFKNFTYKQVEAISLNKENRKVFLGTMVGRNDVSEGQWDTKTSYLLTTAEVPDVGVHRSVQKLLGDWFKGLKEADPYNLRIEGPYVFTPQAQQMLETVARKDEFAKQGIQFRMPDAVAETAVYTSGWGLGQLGLYKSREAVEAGIQSGVIRQDSIIVIGSDLPELPPVAGIISEVPLTEASHLVLLAQMYGIPLIYEKSAIAKYTKLNAQPVYLSSNSESGSFEVFKEFSGNEITELKQLKRKPQLQVQVNWNNSDIVKVDSLKPSDVMAYGGKAMQFGIIRRTIPDNTRNTVVGIPLHYYKRFITEATLPSGVSLEQELIATLQTLPNQPQYALVNQKMLEVKKLFKSAQISPDFFQSLRTTLQTYFPEQAPGVEVRLKIRSSSNVEDGAEFNGAGLYDSEGICLSHCKKDDFAKGLIKVWSSLYTTRGYWARLQFGVDESKVGMGLVAHTPYKNELVNGVVRFKYGKNYNDELESKIEILAVPGEELSVTNADQGGLNEKVEMTEDKINSHRPFKNAPEGRLLMEPKHYRTLVNLMKQLYVQRPNPAVEEIEAEWKLINEMGEESIHIKQVRAVPKLAQSKFANGIKFKVYTGNEIHFTGNWPDNSRDMVLRIEKMIVNLGSFTDQDFYNNKLKMQSVQMQIQGQMYNMQIKSQGVAVAPAYYDSYKFTLTHPSLGLYLFDLTISKDIKSSVLTTHSLGYSLRRVESDQHIHQQLSVIEKEMPPFVYKNVAQELSPKKFNLSKTGCAIKMNGTFSKRWLVNDDEFRSFDHVQIAGLLPQKNIVVTAGYPYANYYYQQHETRYDVWVDLFADPQLTAEEKQVLLKKFGRYISGDGNGFSFYDENNKNRKVIPKCGIESGFSDEGEG